MKEEKSMDFKEEFFKDEVREGFLVDSTMKKVWAAEMEVLDAVIQICDRHHIRYFADWGTLLGAVRHQGYIPWDDDIDIAMIRDDYQRFLKIAPEELPAPLWLKNMYTDETFCELHTAVWSGRAISFEEEYLKKFHGCPYIVGLDIFPLDYVPKNSDHAVLQRNVYQLIATPACMMEDMDSSGELMEEMLWQIEQVCNISIDRTKPVTNQLYRIMDRISSLYGKEDGDELTLFEMQLSNVPFRLKKKWYAKSIKMPFESMELDVPAGYDDVLKTMYGDYHKIRPFTASHDYPCYKTQQKELENYLKTHQSVIV